MKKIIIQVSAVLTIAAALLFGSAAVYAAGTSQTDISSSQKTTAVSSAEESSHKKERSKKPDFNKIIIVSIGISAIISLSTVCCVYHGYKSNGKTETYPYNKAPLNLRVSQDTLIDTNVTKIKIQKNK